MTARPRSRHAGHSTRRWGIVDCRILRGTTIPRSMLADIGVGAVCLVCPAPLEAMPTVVAVLEVAGWGRLTAGICQRCARLDDREPIAAAFADLRRSCPSLRPLSPGGAA